MVVARLIDLKPDRAPCALSLAVEIRLDVFLGTSQQRGRYPFRSIWNEPLVNSLVERAWHRGLEELAVESKG